LPGPARLNNPSLFGVPADEPVVFPVVEFVSTVITRPSDRLFKPRGGLLEREDDLLYCTLVDRFGQWLTSGFVSGLGQVEAFASTYTTSYDLMVLGRDRASMARAAAEVAKMKGGMALVEDGRVSFRLPLELGGLMSDSPMPDLTDKVQELEELAKGFGYPFNDLLYSILFLVCDFLPGLRVTPLGIKDVKNQKIVVPSRPWPR
jgi:adenine deaminase